MKTSHFLLTILLFLALSVCLPPTAMSAEGDSDVRPGLTNPVTTGRQTLFRDDEVQLIWASPYARDMGYMYARPENDDLTSWHVDFREITFLSSDFGPFNDFDIRPFASASGRNVAYDGDHVTYAFFQPDGSVAVEQYFYEIGNWYANVFSGSTLDERSLDIALGDLDGLSDDNGFYRDEIVLVRTTTAGNVKVDVIGHDEDLTSLAGDIIDYGGQALNVAVDIGDLNGDGTLELVVGILKPDGNYQLVVYKYSIDGLIQFVRASTYTGPRSNGDDFDLAVGDFDGDGKDEVFLATARAADDLWLLGADDDLTLQLEKRVTNSKNGVPNTLRVVSGLFKFDPDGGWPLSRRQPAVCYQLDSSLITCNIYEVHTDQSFTATFVAEISPADGWSFSDFTSMDITTGNFVGHGVDKTETSPLMDLAVSYVEYNDPSGMPTNKLRPAMKILSNVSDKFEDKWSWAGGEQDYVYEKGTWQLATTVTATDGDGDTYRLGAPAHIVMDNVMRLDRIMQEPPKHLDYLPIDYNDHTKGWKVINVSAYTTDFATSLHDESNVTLETETTSTSNWDIGGGTELDIKVTVVDGNMDIAGVKVSGETDTKLGYDYKENKSSYNSNYQSQTYTEDSSTGGDDIVQGINHTIDVWRYPIVGYYDADSDNSYGYQEIVMPGPYKQIEKAAGKDHPDWYQPYHENHNLLSYPFIENYDSWEPDDLGSFNIGGDDMKVVMNDHILLHWNSTQFELGIIWSSVAGSGKEKYYNNTLSESEEITIGMEAKATVVAESEKLKVKGKISFHNSNSWGGSTVSNATNSKSTGIHININYPDLQSIVTDSEYSFSPAAYITSTGGAFKVAYAVGPLSNDWWQGQYGRLPDPALNLPNKFKYHTPDPAHGNSDWWTLMKYADGAQWYDPYKMRGFLLRESKEDPDTKGYPLLSSIIVDGDTVRLCARVYNYSLNDPTGPFDVKFYYIPWTIKGNIQVHDPVFQSQMVATASLDSLTKPDGTSREEVCVDWDTTGLSTEYTYNGEIVNTFRFLVVLDEDDDVDEIHELYDRLLGVWADGTNNIGIFPWAGARRVSPPPPDPDQTTVDLDQIDLKIAAGSMAVKTTQGIVSTDDKGGPLHLELGKTYEIRALVEADHDHPFHRLLFLYDGDPDGKDKGKRKGHPAGKGKGNPDGKGKVIGSTKVCGIEAESQYVWVLWTPDTLGKQEIWMSLLEDADEVNPGNAIDSLEVIVVPAKKSHPKKSKSRPKKSK